MKFRLIVAGLSLAALGRHASAQKVRTGDRLAVRILGAEQPFADTVLVSQSGSVVLPKLGPVNVAALDAATLPDSLRVRYAEFLRTPTVEVVVLRRVIVSGEVKKPDIYYVDLNATLPDVIAHAGGVTEFSNNKVSIRRGDVVTPVPNWETSRSVVGELQSGDQVLVGRRSWLMQNILPAVSTVAVLASLLISLRR